MKDALERNRQRAGKERIPDAAVAAKHYKLELLQASEGFDQLYDVTLDESSEFVVKLI